VLLYSPPLLKKADSKAKKLRQMSEKCLVGSSLTLRGASSWEP
jgi:hypothetical protein